MSAGYNIACTRNTQRSFQSKKKKTLTQTVLENLCMTVSLHAFGISVSILNYYFNFHFWLCKIQQSTAVVNSAVKSTDSNLSFLLSAKNAIRVKISRNSAISILNLNARKGSPDPCCFCTTNEFPSKTVNFHICART